jgi:hypothetical protein
MKRDALRMPSAPMLAHFTRASGRSSAIDNLVAILEARAVRGATRMVRSGRPAVCLFDAPLAELSTLLGERNRRRYQPFGIAVDKRYAFLRGARPVIYLPLAQAAAILEPEEMWRVVSIDLARTPPVDWTFEREWRLLGDLPLEPKFSVALVESWGDAEEIYDRFGGKPPCAGVIPLREIFGPQ